MCVLILSRQLLPNECDIVPPENDKDYNIHMAACCFVNDAGSSEIDHKLERNVLNVTTFTANVYATLAAVTIDIFFRNGFIGNLKVFAQVRNL